MVRTDSMNELTWKDSLKNRQMTLQYTVHFIADTQKQAFTCDFPLGMRHRSEGIAESVSL